MLDPSMIAQIIGLLFKLSTGLYEHQVIDKLPPRPPGYYQHQKNNRPRAANGHI